MATEIGVRELRNNVTKIVKQVREEQAEYIVTVHGRPAAILRPIAPEDEERERKARAEEFLEGLQALARQMTQYTRSKTALEQLLEDRSEE